MRLLWSVAIRRGPSTYRRQYSTNDDDRHRLFIAGLIGFIFQATICFLGLSAAVFTIGEIIYAPGEYMLIDNIAPAGMKASYFSAQSLGWLGAAVNPLASGVILTTLPARSLFVVLIIAIVFAGTDVKRNADYPYATGYHLLIICSQ